MPKRDKSSYTDKQKQKPEHIEEGYDEQGISKEEAERRASATVNKGEGGGKKGGRAAMKPGKKASKAASKKLAKK